MSLIPLTFACLSYVAQISSVRIDVLQGLAAIEGGQVGRVTANRDAGGRVLSLDIGPFQINDKAWLGYFTRAWRLPDERATYLLLRDNGCVNAFAAATVMRFALDEAHGDYGTAIGLYNSHRPDLANAYRRRFIALFNRRRLTQGN
jgi:hypothetical protein